MNRSIAPETQRIQQFNPPLCNWEERGGRLWHLGPRRNMGLVRLELCFPGGRMVQSQILQAQATMQLLLSGSQNQSEAELVAQLDALGVRHSFEADTHSHSLVFVFRPELTDRVLPFVFSEPWQCVYPEDKLNAYIQSSQAALARRQQSPSYWAQRNGMANLYGASSFLGQSADPKDYENLNPGILQSYKEQQLALENAMVLVSGQHSDEFCQKIDAFLPKNKHNLFIDNNLHSLSVPNAYLQSDTKIDKKLAHSKQVSMHWGLALGELSTEDRTALGLLNTVMGGYFGSRLMQDIREERGLTYGIGSRLNPALGGYTWTISSETKSDSIELVQEAVINHLNRLQQELIPTAELERAQAYFAGAFRAQFDGPFASAQRAKQNWIYGQTQKDLEGTLARLWSCTPPRLLELAQKHLNPDRFLVSLAGDLP